MYIRPKPPTVMAIDTAAPAAPAAMQQPAARDPQLRPTGPANHVVPRYHERPRGPMNDPYKMLYPPPGLPCRQNPSLLRLAMTLPPFPDPPSNPSPPPVRPTSGVSTELVLERPALSITIPAVRQLTTPAPVIHSAQQEPASAPHPVPAAQPAPSLPTASSRRSMTRQTSRSSLHDEVSSPAKAAKNKGKDKAPAPAPEQGPNGPPPAYAVTGFTPPTLEGSTLKSLVPYITQGFVDMNDALARVVRNTTARQLDLSSQLDAARAEQVALTCDIRDEVRAVNGGSRNTTELPAQFQQVLTDVVTGHNCVLAQVDSISGTLAQVQTTQMEMQTAQAQLHVMQIRILEELSYIANVRYHLPQPDMAPPPLPEPNFPAVCPLKRVHDEDWNQMCLLPVAKHSFPSSTGSLVRPMEIDATKNQYTVYSAQAAAPRAAPAPTVHATPAAAAAPPAPTHALAVAPPPMAVAPPLLPAPIAAPPAPAAPMPVAPQPMPAAQAQAATAPGPTPGVSVTVGPMRWSKDITGQVRTLISIMPHGQTVSRNVRASRAGGNYVYVTFPTIADAHHFAAMWNMARPAGFETVDAQVN
ncbi:hypothetical protein AURDEDRAFT_113426 [Auricularia subglabra TFB-10046 SS5]|nr:hypothetical protein AURDEDRAFT_113426 [Auricularia subglabra TFB-10046 SS5]